MIGYPAVGRAVHGHRVLGPVNELPVALLIGYKFVGSSYRCVSASSLYGVETPSSVLDQPCVTMPELAGLTTTI